MRIHPELMSKLLSDIDSRKYYTFCRDIALAGRDRRLSEMIFFVENEGSPTDSFVCIKKYPDSFAQLFVFSENEALVDEGVRYLLSLYDVCEYELATNLDSALTFSCITDRFEVSDLDEGSNPSYSIGSLSELTHFDTEDCDISLYDPTDPQEKLAVKTELSEMLKKSGELGSWSLDLDDDFKKLRIYLLRENGRLAAYLRVECVFSNFYEIGWLHTAPEMRNRGFAKRLVSYFSNDCIKNDFFPVYGSAVCEASEQVARSCGFSKDEPLKFRRILTVK